MADVAHDLQHEFWQAPLPAQVSQTEAEHASDFVELPACSRCGTEFMTDSRFCYTCGTKRPNEISGMDGETHWQRALAAARERFHSFASSCAEAVRNAGSALPSIFASMTLSAVRRQTGNTVVSLAAFSVGVVCCFVAVFLSFSGTHEPGSLMLAAHLERIEWLLGATAAFLAGLLLKRSSGD